MTARTTDPATSHLAASYIASKRPSLRVAFLHALVELGPSTANEIAAHVVSLGVVNANMESVRKRAKELVDDGLAKYGPARTCKVTKQQAGTLELTNANPSLSTNEPKCTNAERQNSTTDPRRDGTAKGNRQTVPSQCDARLQDKERQETVLTPEAKRVKAVAEFVSREREWIDNWRVASEMSNLARVNGMWPNGTVDEYCRACDLASAQGLIEQEANRVRAKRVAKENKVVQKGLFDAE